MKKKLKLLIIIFFTVTFFNCKTEKKINYEEEEYKRWVGDIEHNSNIDDADFKICNINEKIVEYHWGNGPNYVGEKTSILNLFRNKYKPVKGVYIDGIVRVRFVVNCKGKANRFRTLQADFKYNEIKMNKKIVTQLVGITKGIDEWKIISVHNKPVDYYFYLIFKINNGHITEILP